MKKAYLIMVMLLLFCSCKKEEETTVKGRVYDENAESFVANHKIFLIEKVLAQGIYFGGANSSNYSYDTLFKGVTDSNGNFNFGSFQARKNKRYEYLLNDVSLNKGTDNNITLRFNGSTLINVNFLPPPPYNFGDSLVVKFTHSAYQSIFLKITNSNYNIVYRPSRIISGKYFININKFKSGVYSNIKDTVMYLNGTSNNYDVNW